MHASTATTASARSGLTLLEVLIAAGILVVGLSSVAAILPAASSLLGEAIVTDRATALAANAVADIEFRRVLKASDFQGGIKAVVMGDVFAAPAITTFYNTSPRKRIAAIAKTALDNEAYGSAWYLMTATPVAAVGPYAAGMPVRVAVAVTRRQLTATDSDTAGVQLARVSEGVYRVVITGTNPNVTLTRAQTIQAEANRRAYLAPCSWVLANKNNIPTWLRIGSSWATYAPGSGGEAGGVAKSFVSFTDSAAATAAETSGGMAARSFAGTVRVEEFILPLN